MSCYHPIRCIKKYDPINKTYKIKFLNKAAELDGEQRHVNYLTGEVFETFLIPCGKCIGCRLDYSREWANRLVMEDKTSICPSWFVTLTYDDAHLPKGKGTLPTLIKKHFQDFMKRLRARFPGLRIRFYAAGEYGDRSLRPHYHVVIFGLADIPALALTWYKFNERNQPMYKSGLLADLWPYGFNVVAPFSWEDAAYTARYVTKKMKGKTAEFYEKEGIEPEFSLMSRRPALGREYYEKQFESDRQGLIFGRSNLFIRGHDVGVPRYFRRLTADRCVYESAVAADDFDRVRRKRVDSRAVLTSVLPSQQFKDAERQKIKQVQGLTRGL